MYRIKNETEQLELLRNDSEATFTFIFNFFYRAVYAMAFKHLKNQNDAEDVVQDVFSSLWNNRKVIVITISLRNYLLTAARNKSVSIIRNRSVQQQYIRSSKPLNLDSNNTDNDYTLLNIGSILENLKPPLMVEAFKLVYIEGLSHKEISNRLGITVKSSRTYVSKIIKILKTTLQK